MEATWVNEKKSEWEETEILIVAPGFQKLVELWEN